ncbi:response regulator [Kineococcus sp. SYSU DK006]|uniref:response regulator n=1 Tax=Kineococcus sp. SYSU DK006 TaxID=3383127 RepID=UPI003D7DF08C
MRVVLAEDSVLLREGLVQLLRLEEVDVVAAVEDADALLRAADEHVPDLVLTDVRMPPTFTDEGLRAAIAVRSRHPGTAVVVLSQYVEERYAAELLGGSTRGVGYLLKDRVGDVDEFVSTLRRVAAGGTAVDPEVVSQLLSRASRDDPLERLTPRELEVLQLMAEGRSNAAIAARLVVTDKAVEKHVSNIFAKLGLPPDTGDHRRVLAVLRHLEVAARAGGRP